MLFQFDFSRSDRDLLLSFFRQTEKALERLVRDGVWNEEPILFFRNINVLITDAWPSEVAPEFRLVERFLSETGDDELYARLGRVGLTRLSLRAKLQSIRDWSELAIREVVDVLGAIWRVLQGINIVLGSFSKATELGDLIDEIKQLIENSIIPEWAQDEV